MTEAEAEERVPSPVRASRRRRRENVVGGRSAKSYKVGVSAEENLALRLRADGLGWSVPRLMVESALAERGETVTDRRAAAAELFRVARYLGAVSNNLNQIARATNATGEVHEDLAATLRAVRQSTSRVNEMLLAMRADR